MKFLSSVTALLSCFFFSSITVPLVAAITCSSTEDAAHCEDGKTLVCASVEEKDGSGIGYRQICKKNNGIKDVSIGGPLGGDKTLASCGCCTESTENDVFADLSSNNAKLKFAKSAKKGTGDDKTGCLARSDLICREALPDFKLTASQDEDYGLVTLQTGYSGNDCTWRGGELDGSGPNSNCIVRDTTRSIPHMKNVCVHGDAGTL
jgi:hypothetical protein